LIRNHSINLTNTFDCIIKAFQNPIWAEQARKRFKQNKLLKKVAAVELEERL